MGARVRGPVVATVVLLALAAVFAGGYDGLRPPAGPGLSLHRSRSTDAPQGAAHHADSPTRAADRGRASTHASVLGADLRSAVRVVFLLLLTGGALVVLGTVLRFSVVRRRERHRIRPSPLPTGGRHTDEDLTEPVSAALERGLAELDGGSVRNAVVAAWIRLEEHVARSGVERHPEDTPAELVARASSLDPVALAELADLYREARFSRHPIGEEHRARARACLTRLLVRRSDGVPS